MNFISNATHINVDKWQVHYTLWDCRFKRKGLKFGWKLLSESKRWKSVQIFSVTFITDIELNTLNYQLTKEKSFVFHQQRDCIDASVGGGLVLTLISINTGGG